MTFAHLTSVDQPHQSADGRIGTHRPAGLRVLAVEDDAFTRSLVSGALSGVGFAVQSVDSVAQGVAALQDGDFHAVVTDLDLGPGPSGADLLWHVAEEWPWMGMVVLSSHASPQLAVGSGVQLPDGVGYLVKSDLCDFRLLSAAISNAVRGESDELAAAEPDASRAVVTAAQADVLRMLAAGMSTSVIARTRATSVRAAEMMIVRLYEKLGLLPHEDRDPRTSAVLMWQQGRVRVR